MDNGPESQDSFFIEGPSNNGPNDDNFADDGDFNGPPQGYFGGPRGPPGMGPRGPMGMRPPMRPFGGAGPMGPRPPFGMQRGPPPGPGGYGPRPPPPGQRFQGPPPRGMGGPMGGGPRGPPMHGGYGDFPRPMRPHFPPEANGSMDGMMDGPRGGWDMAPQHQGPPNQPNGPGPGYMGGPQQGPPQNFINVPPPHSQHYGGSMPTQQPPPHTFNNGTPQNYGPGGHPGAGPYGQQPPGQPGPDGEPSPADEVWVETKTGDGKSYFYHAKSRETTWTRPEGPNVKILSQHQVEAMAQQQAASKVPESVAPMPAGGYGVHQPYYPAPAATAWNMAAAAPVGQPPVIASGPVPYPVMLGSDPGTDPVILAQAMEWCQYRSPDGKAYFFNVKSQSSVWEKPQILKDYEVARMTAAARAHAGSVASIQIAEPTATAELAKKEEPKASEPTKEPAKVDAKDKEEVKVPKDKSRPVSSTPVAGTPWCVVWTGDSRVFFYNPSTKSSVWEKPEELKNRPDVDKLLSSTPDSQKDEKKDDPTEDGKKKRTDSITEEPPVKKAKAADDDRGTGSEDEKVEENGKDSAMEAEVKAAQTRAVIPLEERVLQFKEMLAEKEVSAFSTWEKELHKIVFDSRYLLLTSKERKDVYEDYVRERVEEERREKKNRMKEKKDDYRRLMEDAKLHGKSTFSEFAHRFGKDERFRGVEKTREREALFNEFIIEVRRREKDLRDVQREKAKKEFVQFLREQLSDKPSDRNCRWAEVKRKLEDTKDSRLKNVDSSLREEYYREWIRNVREKMEKKEQERGRDRQDKTKERRDSDRSERKDREKDRKDKDRSKGKDKSKSKEKKSKDRERRRREKLELEEGEEPEEGETRDDLDADDDGRESPIETHTIEDDDEDDDDEVTAIEDKQADEQAIEEEERERRNRERKAREVASLREREKEVQRALAPHLRDRDKERQAHQHGEAISVFTALLTDLIRNPDIGWKEAKRTMRKDARSDATEILAKEEKERLFNEHIEKLASKKRNRFREMLDEIGELTLSTAWKKIRGLIKDDPRYAKFSSSDRKCEKEFNEYMKDKMAAAKSDFRELLKESKFISYKTLRSVRDSEQALKDLEATLKKDRRYLQLDCIREERKDLLMAYLEDLERKGPPPPPTATEPTRRDKH